MFFLICSTPSIGGRLGLSDSRYQADHQEHKEEHDEDPARDFEITHTLRHSQFNQIKYELPVYYAGPSSHSGAGQRHSGQS